MSTPAYLLFPDVSSGSVGNWTVEKPTLIKSQRETKIGIVRDNDSKTIDREKAALFAQFNRLASKWRRETGHLSSPNDKCSHSAYQAIIDLGEDVIPYVLRDLEAHKSYWFWALTALMGVDPIPDNFKGSYDDAIKIWLDKAKESGYVW